MNKHTPIKGAIAQQEQDRMDQEQAEGERRYYQSIMADELSNDPDVFDGEDE
jgi:hypothetical protein